VQRELEQRAQRTGVPYATLLEEARAAAGVSVYTVATQRQLSTDIRQLRLAMQRLETRVNRLEGVTAPGEVVAPVPEQAVPEVPAPELPYMAPPPHPATMPLAERPLEAELPAVPAGPPRPWQPISEPELVPARPARDLEDLLSGRVLAWTGGVAILIGALFFLSLAFSRGWIGPTARVAIGFMAAAGMIAGGVWFFERRERLFGHVLVGVGLGVMNIALLAATQLYDLIPIELGLGIALVTAVAAALIAIRANSQVVALFGLFSALIAPPIVGAEAALGTVAFVGVILIGTTFIALYRSWRWLPPLAFLLAAPQAADLLTGDVNIGLGLLVLAAFWLLFAVAAGGEEFRIPRQRLGITSTTVMLANAAFVVAMGFALLDGDAERWRGLFLVGVAAAHGALGGYFLKERGDFHPFGMLAFGTGIAALTIAIPVQLGGPAVPLAWAAEAVALTWLYVRRRHIYSGLYAIALGALAIGHLLTFEYPLVDAAEAGANTWPFLNANGGTLAFLLLALGVAGFFIATRWMRAVLAAVGLTLIILAMPHELSDVGLLAGWALVFLAALALQRWPALNGAPVARILSPLDIPALMASAFAVLHLLTFELPLSEARNALLPDVPFTDQRTLAVAVLAAAAVAGSFLTRHATAASGARVAAFALVAYLMPFEVARAATVVAWSALAAGSALLGRRDRVGTPAYLAGTGVLLGVSGLMLLSSVAPLERLVVDAGAAVDHPFFWSGATAAMGAMLAALLAVQRLYPERQDIVRGARVLAGALAVYLLSVGVVDHFQSQVGGTTGLEALQKQAQVALSILWAVLGVGVFVAGILRFGAPVRLFGLALLALATLKVFIVDLASLDTSYRVLSFIGLGILLLAGSFVYQHYKQTLIQGGPKAPRESA
jgi:uncharacterized membrane protein